MQKNLCMSEKSSTFARFFGRAARHPLSHPVVKHVINY